MKFLACWKNQPEPLSPTQQQKLDELLYQQEVHAEKTLNRILLVLMLVIGVLAIINAVLVRFDPKALANFVGFAALLAYNVVLFLLLRRGLYRPFIKFVTTSINVTVISLVIFAYSLDSGWVHTLRTMTILSYMLPIVMAGFYQSPAVPIYAGVLTAVQYSALFLYAAFFTSVEFSVNEDFTRHTVNWSNMVWIVQVFLMLGAIMSGLGMVMRRVLTRSIRSEAQTMFVQEASELKTAFFINIAHETKTPLTLIGNYLAKYIKKKGEDADLRIIRRNVDRLRKTMIDFLDAEKLERGQLFYDNTMAVDLSAMTRELAALFGSLAGEKGQVLTTDIEDGVVVRMDPAGLERIVNNLLENAIKYTGTGGRLSVAVTRDGDMARLVVSDDGIGMSAEQLDNVFNAYHQVTHRKRNIQGIGMGLNIVKRVLDQGDGTIDVTSAPGEGSTFSVDLPLATHGPDETIYSVESGALPVDVIPGTERVEDSGVEAGRINLLVVEDNSELLAYLRDELSASCNVFVAVNGREALDRLRDLPGLDCILTDVMMDEMDGYQFHEAVSRLEQWKTVPFIFLTARTVREEKIETLYRGAVDYINKPFDIDEVRAKITAIVDNARRHRDDVKQRIIDGFEEMVRTIDDPATDNVDERAARVSAVCRRLGLSDRETEIALLLTDGFEAKEIADQLEVSVATVRKHIQNIHAKAGVNNRAGLLKVLLP
jgi:signal transduction histidine kinase/DNA-binding NarL/FixJ family response regulator